MEFFNKLVDYFKNNLPVFIVCCALLAILIVIIIVLICLGAKKKSISGNNSKEDADLRLVQETLREKEEPQVEEAKVEEPEEEEVPQQEVVVEETKEEPVVEEKVEEEPQVEEKTEEAPLVEEPEVVVEETPVVEEKAAEPKKAPAKKAAAKKTPAKKEEPVVEEPVKKISTAKKVTGKYEILTDGEKFYYQLKASNGQILVKSEPYASKASCNSAIETVKKTSVEGTISIFKDKRDNYQFSLVSKNHRTLVVSANYATEADAVKASESFKRFAPDSNVVEKLEAVTTNKEQIKISVKPKKGGKLIVAKDGDNYFYQLKASNGEVMLQGKNCKTEKAAQSGIDTLRDAVKNGKFYVEKDKRGYYFYKLFSASDRLVAVGESYENKSQAESAANSVYAFIDGASEVEN